jgi:cob(I)alamin adenosyltransferase
MSGSPALSDREFSEPRITINRVYTRHGDGGKTRLAGGQLVSKDDPRIEAYGAVDELNAFIGLARQTATEGLAGTANEPVAALRVAGLREIVEILGRVQHELFNLGSILATLPEDVHPKQARIRAEDATRLEAEIDRCQAALAPLRSFVLPGGCRLNAELHMARTVCRRAERRTVELSRLAPVDPAVIAYLNRLGDALFVWSRWVSYVVGVPEVLWDPNYCGSLATP